MPETASAKIEPLPPQAELIQMARQMSSGHLALRLLYVAAKLNLADYSAEESKTAEELAVLSGSHAPSLYRVMRALTNLGLFRQDGARRFSPTPLGQALNTRAPGSVSEAILMITSDMTSHSIDNLLYSVQTGKPGFEKAFDMPIFDWLANHPEEASRFSKIMVVRDATEPAAVASGYDFSEFETIVDVGGATGNLLASILGRHLGPRGILFDLPHVVRDAPALIDARGLADRISTEAGSFFERVPGGGDAYLLSHIIHDWSESKCLSILGNCRRAMKPGSRLLIVELVLPTDDAQQPARKAEGGMLDRTIFLDIAMLVWTGGQERTEPEYRELLDKAGFRLTRVVPTESAASVVEAFPV
jgi:O-methyltransferase domain